MSMSVCQRICIGLCIADQRAERGDSPVRTSLLTGQLISACKAPGLLSRVTYGSQFSFT